MLAQPRRQLRPLLRLQIHAVVDSFNRLPVTALCCRDLVSGEEFRYLVPHSDIAEYASCPHDFGAGKGPAGLFNLRPMLANKVPC